jgi:hypothetical protein
MKIDVEYKVEYKVKVTLSSKTTNPFNWIGNRLQNAILNEDVKLDPYNGLVAQTDEGVELIHAGGLAIVSDSRREMIAVDVPNSITIKPVEPNTLSDWETEYIESNKTIESCTIKYNGGGQGRLYTLNEEGTRYLLFRTILGLNYYLNDRDETALVYSADNEETFDDYLTYHLKPFML